ncbi:MAG: hypothetical protein J5J06_15785 [Phycisphaerae bacterium]|nr:hypothetical protein [Phycisphaerae bacterium]
MFLLPEQFENDDPTLVTDDCLNVDDIVELEEGSAHAEHLRHCAACQLRYYEALALSAIGAEEFNANSTDGFEPAIVYSLKRSSAAAKMATPILAAGYRIAASFGALILGSDLISGLLGPGEDEPVAEAVVREGHALKDVRIELDAEGQTLVVAALPATYPVHRLRLRTEDELLEPAASSPSEARFDLSGAWDDGDHNFELVLVEP